MVIDNPKAINAYVALVLASAIDLYVKTGMKANRAYTPTNMLKTASRLTGRQYKRNQLRQAAADLREAAH
jgi:hypothetical protein